MNTISYFEIQSSEPKREFTFYKTVFGWKIEKDENISIPYYRIQTTCIDSANLERLAKVPPKELGTIALWQKILMRLPKSCLKMADR